MAASAADLLRENREEILRIAEKHGASNVRVFGSVARGEADERSDIDLLVRMEPDRGLLNHAALWLELEKLLGREVDVVSEKGLRPRVREHVLRDARPL
jgi:predicted nucleotidyltransferase